MLTELTAIVFILQLNMTRKCHNHRLQPLENGTEHRETQHNISKAIRPRGYKT